MDFSLKAFFDQLDSYPEHRIMATIMEMYEGPTKGMLFNEKFIPMTDMVSMGYRGFKNFLYILLDTNSNFIEGPALAELRALILTLKGDLNG